MANRYTFKFLCQGREDRFSFDTYNDAMSAARAVFSFVSSEVIIFQKFGHKFQRIGSIDMLGFHAFVELVVPSLFV